jgi:hypothetical protein
MIVDEQTGTITLQVICFAHLHGDQFACLSTMDPVGVLCVHREHLERLDFWPPIGAAFDLQFRRNALFPAPTKTTADGLLLVDFESVFPEGLVGIANVVLSVVEPETVAFDSDHAEFEEVEEDG